MVSLLGRWRNICPPRRFEFPEAGKNHLVEVLSMSTIAMTLPAAPIADTTALNGGSPAIDGVVEIQLLLPAQWAQDLMQLSRERRQSVGQVLRSMIGHALHEDGTGS
jgi:hypothetical protein